MSFILDALKKSETDRQRQTGPALFEVKVAQPKGGFPLWAIAIVALLVVNMLIVGWLLLRRSSRSDAAAVQNTPPAAMSQSASTAAPNAVTRSASIATLPRPTNGAPTPSQSNNNPQQAYVPPGAQDNGPASQGMERSTADTSRRQSEERPAVRMPDRDQNEPTLAGGTRGAGGPGGSGSAEGSRGAGGAEGAWVPGANRGRADAGGPANGGSSGTAGAATNPGATGGVETGSNPDDYAPAQDPGSPIFKGHVRRGTESGLMLYQDLAVANGSNLPELRLDMHVYDPKPQSRFALVNMRKVVEGDTLKDGVRVEAITPEGVVMSHNGTRFLLPRD